MKPKRRRLLLVLAGMASLALAFFLIARTFNDNLVFFYAPSELYEKKIPADKLIRIGGLVEEGSLKKNGDEVSFSVTDYKKSVPVEYKGLLPDLFREGQGAVVQGKFANGKITATEILAKHDERYMPPEVARALKKSGRWNEGAK